MMIIMMISPPCRFARDAGMGHLKQENDGLRRLVLKLKGGLAIRQQGAGSSGMKIDIKEDDEGMLLGPKQVNMGNKGIEW